MKNAFLFTTLLLLASIASFAQLNRFKEGGWYHIIAAHSGKALEIELGVNGNKNGSQLQQNDSTGADNQLFQFKKYKAGYYTIIVKQSGKVLEVRDCSDKDHAVIQQNHANGNECQFFTTAKDSNGYYAIIAKNSGYGFDVLGGVTAMSNSTAIIQYPVSGAPNQLFRIVEAK